ncbi:regulatory protein SWI4-like isoform X2 [Mizuhopecten yessoensis]|uniref:regulatory protein SWI4-like isoform X2 n=1 Tax=Mizuhopecten yessoensis TaxID=6573 RepID=UPI000B45CEDC|nr:regulatory protein SWI4-like isoform X2 [Mizuhopecten yessoensis]
MLVRTRYRAFYRMRRTKMTITTKRCPIYCPKTCSKQHHPLLIALINTNTSEEGNTSFTALEATISRYITVGKWSICDDIDDPDPDYKYPLLHWAACLGKVAVVKWLVQRNKVCVFARHISTYDTALHTAIYSLQKTCQRAEAGQVFSKLVPILSGSLACRNSLGDTPLHLVCRSLLFEESRAEYFSDCISHILKFADTRGAGLCATIVNAQNNVGDTPVHIMAENDRTLNIVKMMVDLGKVDFNLTNSKNQNALQVAIALGQMKTAKYLHQLIESAPKKRNGSITYVSIIPKYPSAEHTSVNDSDNNDCSPDSTKKNRGQRKAKKIVSTSAIACKVTSTEDSAEESPENNSDLCLNSASTTSEIEEEAVDGTSLASNPTTDSPSSTSLSSTVEQSSIPTENPSNNLGKRLNSAMPAKSQTTKLTGKVLPNVCSSAPLASSSSSSSEASTSASTSASAVPPKEPAVAPVTNPSSDPVTATSSSYSLLSDKNCGPSPAKRKKMRVLVVKKGPFPTSQMIFTDQVQFTPKVPKVTSSRSLLRSERIPNKPIQEDVEDTAECEQLSNIKVEMDIAQDDEMCPDSNTSSPDVMITRITSLPGHQSGTANRNSKAGPGKALIDYLSMYGDSHRSAILANLNNDRDDYQKQKGQLHTQIKGIEKEIQDGESEMEEKNNRLKDILLEVEQLQTRVFNLAKQSIGQKETLSTLKSSVGEVNTKLGCCEKAIMDMS